MPLRSWIRERTVGTTTTMYKPGSDAIIQVLSKRSTIQKVHVVNKNVLNECFTVDVLAISEEFMTTQPDFIKTLFGSETYWDLKKHMEPFIIAGGTG